MEPSKCVVPRYENPSRPANDHFQQDDNNASNFRPTEQHAQYGQLHFSPRRHNRCSSMDAERWSEIDQDGSCVDQHRPQPQVARTIDQTSLIGNVGRNNNRSRDRMTPSTSEGGNSRRDDVQDNELQSSSTSVSQSLHPHTNKTIHVVRHTAVVGGPGASLPGGRASSPTRSATVDFVSELTSLNDDGGGSEQDPFEAFRQRHNNRNNQRHQHTGRYSRAGSLYYESGSVHPPPVPELGERCLSGSVGAARGSEIASSIGRACHIQTHLLVNQQQHDDRNPACDLRTSSTSQHQPPSNNEVISNSDMSILKETLNRPSRGTRDRHSDTFLYSSNSGTDAEFASAVEAAVLAELSTSAGELFDSDGPQYVGEATSEAGVDVSGPSAAAEAAAFDSPQLYAPPANSYHGRVSTASVATPARVPFDIVNASTSNSASYPGAEADTASVANISAASHHIVGNTTGASASSPESDTDVAAIAASLESPPTVNKPRSRSQRHLYQQWKRQQQALRPSVANSDKDYRHLVRSGKMPSHHLCMLSRTQKFERSTSGLSSSLDAGDLLDAEERMEGNLSAVLPDTSSLYPRSQSNKDDLQMLTHLIDEMDADEENQDVKLHAAKSEGATSEVPVSIGEEKDTSSRKQTEVVTNADLHDGEEIQQALDIDSHQAKVEEASSDKMRCDKRRSRLLLVQKNAAAAAAEVSKLSSKRIETQESKDAGYLSDSLEPVMHERHGITDCHENEESSFPAPENVVAAGVGSRRVPSLAKRRPLTYRRGDYLNATEKGSKDISKLTNASVSRETPAPSESRDKEAIFTQNKKASLRRERDITCTDVSSPRSTTFTLATSESSDLAVLDSRHHSYPFLDMIGPSRKPSEDETVKVSSSPNKAEFDQGAERRQSNKKGGNDILEPSPGVGCIDSSSSLRRVPKSPLHSLKSRSFDNEGIKNDVCGKHVVPDHDEPASILGSIKNEESEVSGSERDQPSNATSLRGERYIIVNTSHLDERESPKVGKIERLISKSRRLLINEHDDTDVSDDRATHGSARRTHGSKKRGQNKGKRGRVEKYHTVPNTDEEEGHQGASSKSDDFSEKCDACGFEWGPWEKAALIMFLLSFGGAVASLLVFEIILAAKE